MVHQLEFPIWLSRLDTEHTVEIPSPTTEDTVITTPLIPGLEVRLPAGTVIRDRDGHRVTEVSITPIPVDQPPFPLPAGVVTPVYFTVQPGGAVILPEGAQVVYPNPTGLPAGSRVEFWDYDATRVPCTNPPVKSYPKPERETPAAAPDGCQATGAEAGWYVYGHGTVTEDGTQVVPDPDVRVWEFTGTMINSGLLAALFGPGEDGASGGDPVDLGTGLFVESHTDLVVQDVIPISITRTYRQLDERVRPFGIGTNFNYGIFLQSARQYQEADLVLPDSQKVHFVRTSAGTGFTDAVFKAVDTTGPYRDAVLAWNGRGWDLTRTDGMTYVFGDEQPLQAIRDRHGNQVTLTWSGGPSIIPGQGGNIVQITSPNGRWIRLTYEPDSNLIASATDNGGRTVEYEYDEQGRLVQVTSPAGRTTSYSYDAEDRLTSITDARGITYLTNTYDGEGRVVHQQLPGGASYEFDYTTDADGDITATTVTDPEGVVRRVTFDADGRVATETFAVGTPLERTTTTVRDPATGLPTQLTDPYGRTTQLDYGPGGVLDSVTTLAGTSAAESATITAGGPYQQLQSVIDKHGRSASVGYDERGNPSGSSSSLRFGGHDQDGGC